MPTETINLVGAGGHALVVADALTMGGREPNAIRFWDSSPQKARAAKMGYVVSLLEGEALAGQPCHIAIGGNDSRERWAKRLRLLGCTLETILHPTAIVAQSVTLGDGSFVAAGATIGPFSKVGLAAIVNHGAVIDHECHVGNFTHIAPGAILGGGVEIGRKVLVGARAVVLPGLRVADKVTIGAGAVVTRSISKVGTYKGVPARRDGEN